MCNRDRMRETTQYMFNNNDIEKVETESTTKSKPLWKRFCQLGACLVVVAFAFCFARPGNSPTPSMAPTIPSPCVCLTAPMYGMMDVTPERFDVVCVKITEAQSKELKLPPYSRLCKRVIGLGGEKLEIKDGLVYINDELLQEPYLPADYIPHGNFGPYYIPEGHVFLMGDNRNNSLDSRFLENPFFSYDSIVDLVWLSIKYNDIHLIK